MSNLENITPEPAKIITPEDAFSGGVVLVKKARESSGALDVRWEKRTYRQTFGDERAHQIQELMRGNSQLVLERRLVDPVDLSNCIIGGPIAVFNEGETEVTIHTVFRKDKKGKAIFVGVTTIEPDADGYTYYGADHTIHHQPVQVISGEKAGKGPEGISVKKIESLNAVEVRSRRLLGYQIVENLSERSVSK